MEKFPQIFPQEALMGYPASVIPEKIFFKIGEVCDLVGVQAHVLRYWETEFPMLSPQKNRSGQRTYRRRDVEIAFRVKELLYDEMFTIAGAKKKLQSELRDNSKLKIVHPEPIQEESFSSSGGLLEIPEDGYGDGEFGREETVSRSAEKLEAIKSLAAQLLELREMVKVKNIE